MKTFKILLGYTKPALYGTREPIYLKGFEWACGWYWSGGHVGNSRLHCHFDGCFLDTPDSRWHPLGSFVTPWDEKKSRRGDFKVLDNGCGVWEPITTFLDDVPKGIASNWWRIKDLYKQFYAYCAAAECAQYGGHCSSSGRIPEEKQPELATTINAHIENVIIPEIMKALGVKQ